MTRVLVVDDKEDNLYYLDILLRSHGYDVETARHGAEALARARQSAPDVIVADLLMPIMDGYTLLRHWKADPRLRQIPFVVYTATYTAREDEDLAYNLGADDFIVKPAEPEDLLARIRNAEVTAGSGETRAPSTPSGQDEAFVKQYSSALVRKLEEKTIQLEASNRALGQEIAERKRIALMQSAILDALPAHVALLDPQGQIVAVNGSWRQFASADGLRSPDFRVGADFLEVCDRMPGGGVVDGHDVADGVRDVLAARRARFTVEYPSASADGERWFRVIVTPLLDASDHGAVVTHLEVTDRKKREAEVEDIKTRLETLIGQAPVGVIVHRNLKPIMVNDHLVSMFGYRSKEEMLALPDASLLFSEEEQDRARGYSQARIAGEEAPRVYSAKARRSDGSVFDIENRAFAIPWGGATAVGAMITDVTDQRRLEEQLRQSQRLEAIGQMTGGVAHDFNNLLTVILGNAEILEDRLESEPLLRRLAGLTRTAAERAAELTSRLLAFSRRQPLNPRAVDIDVLLSELRPLLRRAMGEAIELKTVCARGLWHALVDAAQLESALLNLAVNARDAMPNGGRLTIEASNVDVDDTEIDIDQEMAPGRYVLVAVADNGVGMDEATRLRAFDPFFTTKDVGKGSGLGLSMVYGFVKQSDGHVRIYSEPGQGTVVKLYLPMSREAEQGVERPSVVAESPGGTERILVVEDDDMVREQVIAHLRALGYDVLSARDGIEAIEALRRTPDVRLLFTDMVMPRGINGRELAEEALRLQPDLAVLYTSGYTEDAIIHRGRLDQGVNLLNKPYRRQDLAVKVRAALDTLPREIAIEPGPSG
jgi:PAS domain S-box-containing protein